MASLRKRGSKWEVQVRKQGHPHVCRTFTFKADATAWARSVESRVEAGELVQSALRIRVGELLTRYLAEVTVPSRGW